MDETQKTEKLPRLPHPRIRVSAELAEEACKKNIRKCMIAEAIRQQVPGAANISVDLMTIRWTDKNKGLRYTYHTPKAAQIALLRFDGGKKIEPFSFEFRSGHISATRKRNKLVHQFGQRRINVERRSTGGAIVETIGGSAPPIVRPKHPSHGTVRAFGLGGFTDSDGTVLGWTDDAKPPKSESSKSKRKRAQL